jgi:Cu-processing system ATP-binding protein
MIEFLGFTKTFGSHCAVADLSLEAHRGETVALLGPNGSGKTTSLKAAAGLIRPTSGDVFLGKPGRPATEPRARRDISYLPQKVSFPEALTGYEVVEFYRALRGAEPGRTGDVLRFASLNGASGRAVSTYSGGMVQRLGLAVAMLADSPVLLLDEPTAALDPEGLSAFYALMERRKHDRGTVLFTSHQLGDVERLADRFAVLVEGRLVATLSRAELHERLGDRGVMRVRLAPGSADPAGIVSAAGPDAAWSADEIVVRGTASTRPAVLDRIRAAGGEIRAIATEEGRLDLLYRELVGDRQ